MNLEYTGWIINVTKFDNFFVLEKIILWYTAWYIKAEKDVD